MTFIYTGDFNVDEAEKRIQATFTSIKNPKKSGATPNLGTVPTHQEFQTLILPKDGAATALFFITLKPHEHKPDTKAHRGEKLSLTLANSIIKHRLFMLETKKNSLLETTNVSRDIITNFAELQVILVEPKNSDWKSALPTIEQELRRAILHGFTKQELEQAKARLIRRPQQAVKTASSRKTTELASALAKHLHDYSVFATPEDNLKILQQYLEKITPQTCQQAFKKAWAEENTCLLYTSPSPRDKRQSRMPSSA